MFGSDYSSSYGVATISEQVGLMKKFFSTKTRAEAEKYFRRNAGRSGARIGRECAGLLSSM
jgi:hypothetical protein